MRQQTLQRAIAWSYDLLDAAEQRLFRRLAVFVGSCTLEAVEGICAALDEDNSAMPVLDSVASLIDKSLLLQIDREGEEPRLTLAGKKGRREIIVQVYFAPFADAEPEMVFDVNRGGWREKRVGEGDLS